LVHSTKEGAVTLILAKRKPPIFLPPDIVLSTFAEKIDLVGQLAADAEPIIAQIKTLQEKLKPLAAARAALDLEIAEIEVADDYDDHVELGEGFKAEIGKKGSSRSISDLDKVKKLMGTVTFMKVATVTLKDIDAYLTPPEKAQCLTTTRGARSCKIIKRV
jgi:hypothetical protein